MAAVACATVKFCLTDSNTNESMVCSQAEVSSSRDPAFQSLLVACNLSLNPASRISWLLQCFSRKSPKPVTLNGTFQHEFKVRITTGTSVNDIPEVKRVQRILDALNPPRKSYLPTILTGATGYVLGKWGSDIYRALRDMPANPVKDMVYVYGEVGKEIIGGSLRTSVVPLAKVIGLGLGFFVACYQIFNHRSSISEVFQKYISIAWAGLSKSRSR